MKFEEKLPYARNRVAECYLWAVTVYFEPQYSLDRIIFAQTILMLSITDDTYDAYGTLDELKIFTDAVQRLLLILYNLIVTFVNYYLITCYSWLDL